MFDVCVIAPAVVIFFLGVGWFIACANGDDTRWHFPDWPMGPFQ